MGQLRISPFRHVNIGVPHKGSQLQLLIPVINGQKHHGIRPAIPGFPRTLIGTKQHNIQHHRILNQGAIDISGDLRDAAGIAGIAAGGKGFLRAAVQHRGIQILVHTGKQAMSIYNHASQA